VGSGREKRLHGARNRKSRARANPLPPLGALVFTSALTGQRVRRTLDLVLRVQAERERRIPTPELNRELGRLVARHPPAHSRGRAVKVRYGTQVGVAPPAFVLFSNLPREIQPAYVRYLENGFRSRWPLAGSPLRMRFKADGGSGRG